MALTCKYELVYMLQLGSKLERDDLTYVPARHVVMFIAALSIRTKPGASYIVYQMNK